MAFYLVRRLAQLIPVLFVVSVALFVLLQVLPGDPTVAVLGQEATAEQRAALRSELGLDRPLAAQYVSYAWGVVQGDFGTSYITGESVLAVLGQRLPVTVELGLLALLLAVALGVPAGVFAALRRRSKADNALTGVGVAALATPHFYLAALLILVFAVELQLLPSSGYTPFTTDPLANLQYLLLPTITVGLSIAAVTMRQTRASMLSSLGEEFVRTAVATGLSRRRVVLVYALRNAIVPVVTVVGLQVGALVSAAVITETIYTLPGLGSLIVSSIFSRDLPVVQGAVLVVVVFVLLINLLTDLVYAWLDPRITL